MKWPGAVENRAAQIIVERQLARFESVEHQFVAVLKIRPIEVKFLDGELARVAIPAVGEDHAAVVPEECVDFSHQFPESKRLPRCQLRAREELPLSSQHLNYRSGILDAA